MEQMEQDNPQDEPLQAVRPVHKNNLFPTILAPVAHVVINNDPISGRKIILWDDILQAFQDASHPRHGTKCIPFLKGPDLKCLDPLRFNAVPDAILDIVVDGKFTSTDPPPVQGTLEDIANRAAQYTAHNPYGMIHSTPPTRNLRSPSSEYSYDTPNYEKMPTPAFWNHYAQPPSHQTRTPSPLPPYSSSSVRTPPPTRHTPPRHTPPGHTPPGHTPPRRTPPSRPPISSSRPAPPSKLNTRKYALEAFRKIILHIDLVKLEEKGEGTPEEFTKALECYLKAVCQGHGHAHLSVGELFAQGKDVTQDEARAYEWYLKAAYQGNAVAQRKISRILVNQSNRSTAAPAALLDNTQGPMIESKDVSPKQSMLFNPRDYPFVIAIEIGATFSACAYAYAQDDKEVIDITSWPKQSIQYPKTPTLNLYKKGDPENKLVAWGWRAKLETLKPTARHYTLLDRYTLHLDENHQSSSLDVGISVLDAISHYLEALHEYVVGEILRGFSKNFQREHFRYCLTVPAKWSERSKNIMQQAAVKANLIKDTDHPDRLMLISEIEAAALYCERKCDQFNFGNRDRFMVCQANETVDITIFEIAVTTAGRRLSEVTKGHGASCGSVVLDCHMRRLLEERFGYHTANFPANIIPDLVDSFADVIKPQFDGLEDQFLLLPANRCFEDFEDPEAIGIDDGYLVLTAAELKEKVFDPVIKDVLSLIQEQLNRAVDCGAIFLVGGFGASNYLYSRVKAEFSNQVGLISVPPRLELAVVRGAVYAGLNPRVVTSRISRRCYGISSDQPFEEGKDPLTKRKFEANGVWCIDRFSPYVKRGQRVNIDECISREILLTNYSEVPMDYRIAFYAADTDSEPPRYTTDDGVSKLAEILIPYVHLPSSPFGYLVKVKVNMNFGMNEIKAEAVVGDKVYTTILPFDAVDVY
ncbi:hypothetical protein EC991_010593 [Linnemannia zychae]|nr:hypothetical protein EC991_010593 [Linnemannia zychae]